MLSDRIGVLLFLRGDVRPSALEIPVAVSSNHMNGHTPVNTYPGQAWKLGFVGRLGTVVEKDGRLELPSGAKACLGVEDNLVLEKDALAVPLLAGLDDAERLKRLMDLGGFGEGALDLQGGPIRSSTGELQLHANAGTFQASTPRSEVFVLNGAGELSGPFAQVRSSGSMVVSLSSLDGLPLAKSRRILVIHLVHALHEGTVVDGTVVKQWGTEPKFVTAAGRADLALRFDDTTVPARVWALDFSGKRTHEIPARQEDSTLSFTAEVEDSGPPCFVYELMR